MANGTLVIFKKYFKAQNAEGFLTIKPWFEAHKLSIDIGAVSDGSLQSSTLVWVDWIELNVYLQAVLHNNAEVLFPAKENQGASTPEAFVSYGGSKSDDGTVVARVLKIHRWNEGDGSSFAWKTGAFEGRASRTNAVIPDMTKPISQNLIKITRLEMVEIACRVDLGLRSYVTGAGEEFWIRK